MKKYVFALFVLVVMNMPLLAKEGVKIGDTAPALSYDEWIKGDTVKTFSAGTVYLVEFWGTWCGPCIKNIPHLSKLQQQYASAGLQVIGVASHEFKPRDVLTKFMNERGADMKYRVAYDADQSMERDWDTGGKKGVVFRLPICFIVDKGGKIRFVGHPEDASLEPTLKEALDEKAPK
jgi:thiol-disulfide isomerase/thioredoxin